MTRPGRFGVPIPILDSPFGVLGKESPVDPETGEPIDQAIDAIMEVAVQVGGGTGSLVQFGVALAGVTDPTAMTVTLDDPVGPGHLLVAFGVKRSSDELVLTPDGSGWTVKPSVDANQPFSSGGAAAFAYKVTDGTEGDQITIDVNDPTSSVSARRLVVAEFAGPTALADYAPTDEAASGTTHTTDSVTPPADLDGLLIAAGIQAANGTPTMSAGSGYTEVSTGAVAGDQSPRSVLEYRAVAPTSGSYTADIESSAAGNLWASFLAVFAGDAPAVWRPAPGVQDEDDDTYEEVDGGTEVLRGWFSEGSKRINSARLLIATENAGSRTYFIEGGNELDFSDMVTLASVTFTAVGSFTPQEVLFAWGGSAEYEFFRVTGDDEVRRFHTLSLFGPIPFSPDDIITDHPDLTGRDEADQHPADAVSYDPAASGLTATDVQAAIDEVASATSPGGEDTSYVEVAATGSAETLDCSVARTYDLTFDESCTLTLTGAVDEETHYLTVLIRQSGAGGHTITWPGSVTWMGTPVTTTTSDVQIVNLLTVDGGANWIADGEPAGADLADTVVTETSFGLTSTAGVAETASRSDHAHGTPSAPVTGSGGLPLTAMVDGVLTFVVDEDTMSLVES